MHRRIGIVAVASTLGLLCLAGAALADVVCPDSSYCVVHFACTYSGNYQKGQPYDYVTVSPDGSGDTFASAGVSIRVCLKNCEGQPIAGVPAQQILLFNSALCTCPGGNIADAPTDANGCTTFSGTLHAGGCGSSLDVYAEGIKICTIPVKINSPDVGIASPCFVDADDRLLMRSRFGRSFGDPQYSICHDLNEDGIIDLTDWAILISYLGTCQ